MRQFMIRWLILLLLGSWTVAGWGMDAACAKFLKTYVNPTVKKTVLTNLRNQAAVQALRPIMQQYSSYFAQPLLACDSEVRLVAWQKIWWVLQEAYDLGHQWQVHPLAILVAAGDLRPSAISRWMVFLHYARLPASVGHIGQRPTLAAVRALAGQLWPRGKVMRPADDLADFLAVQQIWIIVAHYLSGHPTKSLAQVLASLALRQEITQHLRWVGPVIGLTRPPVVAGLLAQTNHFKNQIRLLRQAVRKQDHALLMQRWQALRSLYGLSWAAVMEEANLPPRDQQRLWAAEMEQAAARSGRPSRE